MTASVVALLEAKGAVTFAEIAELPRFGEGAKPLFANDPANNVVLWTALTPAGITTLSRMFEDGMIKTVLNPQEAIRLLYFALGSGLPMPIAKSFGPFQRPRWLPALVELRSDS